MTDPIEEVVDRYLNEVSWAMRGSLAEQQAARDELREHIHAEMQDLELQGVDRGTALTQALHDLGDPSEVGRAMRASLRGRSLRRPLQQPEGALVFGPHRERHLPALALVLAIAAAVTTTGLVALVFIWPV
jgi:hypothetical protein